MVRLLILFLLLLLAGCDSKDQSTHYGIGGYTTNKDHYELVLHNGVKVNCKIVFVGSGGCGAYIADCDNNKMYDCQINFEWKLIRAVK
jgi:hypothetical protein